MAAKRRLAEFLHAVTGDETNYFERALKAVGAPGAVHTPPPLNDVTEAFRTLMIDTASGGSYAEILSILVPAEWIYLTWASEAVKAGKRPTRFYLDEWIHLHAGPGFEGFVLWIREELDREISVGPATRARATALFAQTVELEVKFFDAVYE
jgi:thiaminase/transcriptional activator TenA